MKQVDKDIAGAIYNSGVRRSLIPLDKKPESIITKSLMATDGTRVEITYSEKDKKTSAYILDIDGKERIEIKPEYMPRDLREIRDSSVFNAFLMNVYANTRIITDGDVSLEVSQRLLGGMMPRAAAAGGAGGGDASVPEELVRGTIRLTEAGLGRIDTSDPRAVIVMGHTGVGKSTLINLLANVPLEAFCDEATGIMRINAPAFLSGFKIGHSVASETAIPNKWRSPDGVVFWDCPGFLDNRGEAQEIANATFIKKLFDTPQVKIVIMVKESDIIDTRAPNLIQLIEQLEDFFAGDVSQIRTSVSLAVSHVLSTRQVRHIQGCIDRVIREAPGLNDARKSILELLKNNPINIIRAPVIEGPIDVATIRGEITANLDAVRYAHAEAKLCLTPSAKAVALASYNELNNYIARNVREFTERFKETIQQFAARCKDKLQLQAVAQRLNEIFEGHEYSVRHIPEMITSCLDVSRMCSVSLDSRDLNNAIAKVESVQFLEQFIDDTSRIPLQIVRDIRDQVIRSIVTIEKEIIGIEARDAEERARLETVRAEREAKRADEEAANARAAEARARAAREDAERARAQAAAHQRGGK